ncbi:MAG: sensor domain-containing diguanylate cyclase [Thermoleophilaceae bacterium]|nr:sensor domain-containing diguanylate cyclase [Thermoleophilaceae bacterium]
MDGQAVNAAADLTARRFSSFSEATRAVLEMLEEQLPAGAVFVAHFDDAEDRWRVLDARGDSSFDLAPGTSMELSESLCIRMASGISPMLSGDVQADPSYGALGIVHDLDIGSYAGVPLLIGEGGPIGSLCAIAHDLDAYTQGDLQLLQVVANMLAYQLERDRAQRELEILAIQLREQATTDALTGVLNRRSFGEALDREWALGARDRIPSYVVMLDLDGFKEVNDRLGHAAGDRVLLEFADTLREVTRGTDVVGRVGGDEFAVILVRALADGAAERFVERLREALEAQGADVGASAGHALLVDAESPAAALAAADELMYADKRARQAGR